jgi:hypothetical protein
MRAEEGPLGSVTCGDADIGRLVGLLRGRAVAAGTWGEDDWQSTVGLATTQRVAPQLYARLKECGIAPPPAAAQRLRGTYIASIGRSARLLHQAGSVCGALLAAGIPVIPLKGAYLAEAVYGDVALRPMTDVDLLVKLADLGSALAVLETLGYVAAPPFKAGFAGNPAQPPAELFKPGGALLDVHWTIVPPGKNVLPGAGDLAQIWERATPARIAGVPVLALSPEDMLLHLCLHASVQHRFEGVSLLDFWDVALVIRRFGDEGDWDGFVRRVDAWGVANGVYLTLRLAEEWTGVAMPAAIARRLATAVRDDAAMAWAAHKVWHQTSLAAQTEIASFEGGQGLGGKLAALRGTLFPSRASMAASYHTQAESWRVFLYYPVRFKDLWVRYGGTMWQVLRRDKTVISEARREAHLRDYMGER